MKLQILGSSGNTCTPWPTCSCRVCTLARTEGGKNARYGNHLYLPDDAILTDVSEHVFYNLNRFNVMNVQHLLISHWHPDHTAGMRVLQALGGYFLRLEEKKINVYMTMSVYQEIIEKVCPALDYYLEKTGAELIIVGNGQTTHMGSTEVTFVTIPEWPDGPHTITAFLLERDGKRVMFAPDETKYLDPTRPEFENLDLIIKESGYFLTKPDGERQVPEGFEQRVPHEITFEGTIEQLRTIKAKRAILTELEEVFDRTHEEYEQLAAQYPELNLAFAYDGMEVEL